MTNFKENWNGFEKQKNPKRWGWTREWSLWCLFFDKTYSKILRGPANSWHPIHLRRKGPVFLFYLRPWQSLRQNSTMPEILEEFLIQWAPKKEKNWRMNARTCFSLFRIHLSLPKAYKLMCFDRNRNINGNRDWYIFRVGLLVTALTKETYFSIVVSKRHYFHRETGL